MGIGAKYQPIKLMEGFRHAAQGQSPLLNPKNRYKALYQ
jgi:hypothetical protein